MDIRKQSPEFYRIYDDKKEYYLKNLHGNILVVSKVIAMERFGYIFTRAKDTPTEDYVGVWKKRLPADEGFEVVEKKDWEEMERKRLGANPPSQGSPKLGPDESKLIKAAEATEAKARADAEVKAAEEAADKNAKAKADAKKGNK